MLPRPVPDANAQTLRVPPNPGGTFTQPNVVALQPVPHAPMNIIPQVSYTSLPMTVNSIPNAVFAPGVFSQQTPHHTMLFPGTTGNFILTQPGGAPVMLAPRQSATPGTFLLAQPVPVSVGSNVPLPSHPNPSNCILRLPDGRFVMPAPTTPPISSTSNVGGLPTGPQTTYYPIPMPTGSISPSITTPTSQQQQSVGLIAPPPGQAFYIQVPPNHGSSVGGTMLAAGCNPHGTALQGQPGNLVKPQSTYTAVPALPNRHPIVMSSTVPVQTLNSNAQPVNVNPNANRPPSLSVPTAMCIPLPIDMLTNQVSQSTAKFCTNNTGIGVNFPAGTSTARLPNGIFTTSFCNRPQSPPVVACNSSTSLCNPIPSASCTTSNVFQQPSINRATSKANVLHLLDVQIKSLQGVQNPSDPQRTQLKQLLEVRQQLVKRVRQESLESKNSNSANISFPIRREILDILSKSNLLPKVNVSVPDKTFVVEFRLNQQRYHLRLTQTQKVDMERLLFSVSSQRQAEILTILQQEQARVFNNRQRPPSATTPASFPLSSAPLTSSFSHATTMQSQLNRLPLNVQSFPQFPIHSAAFSQTSGLRFVAARPMLPNVTISNSMVRGVPATLGSNAPMMGVVTALAMPSLVGSGASTPVFTPNLGPGIPTGGFQHGLPSIPPHTAAGIFLSSAIPAGAQTFVMQHPVMTPAGSTSTTMIPVTSTTIVHSQPSEYPVPLSESLQLSPAPVPNQIARTSISSSKQLLRATRMRAYVSNDIKAAVDRPLQASSFEITPDGLLNMLAPYHVYQDADNSAEAIAKIDRILDQSMAYLCAQKRRTLAAVDAEFYKTFMTQLLNPLEDRLLSSQMMLDLERDIFSLEKEEYSKAIEQFDAENHIDSAYLEDLQSDPTVPVLTSCAHSEPSGDAEKNSNSVHPTTLSDLLGPLSKLRPLKFDKNGNATVSLPNLNEIVANGSAISPSVKCLKANTESDGLSKLKGTTTDPKTVVDSGDSIAQNSSSDEAEADLLLGLDTRHARLPSNEHINTESLLDGQMTSMSDTADGQNNSSFDDTYDLWQELMREEGIDAEAYSSRSYFSCAMSSLSGEPPKKSSRLSENGPTVISEVQHSEDPDLDAAIRSILSHPD